MVGNLKVGDQIRQTLIKFRNIDDYEAYINAIDEGYDAEDAIFIDYINKINIPQFKKVVRNLYRNGSEFKHENIEYRGYNCFIPSKGYCFIKCVNFSTSLDYKQQFLDFIRNEDRRSNVMTKARIQPCPKKLGIHLGYYNDERIFPRTVTNRNSALYFYNNIFCLLWKSQGVSFNQAIQDLKNNFKIVDNYITEKNVSSCFEYRYKPKKIESHLTNFITYDLETLNTDRARPYNMSFYTLGIIACRYGRDPTEE